MNFGVLKFQCDMSFFFFFFFFLVCVMVMYHFMIIDCDSDVSFHDYRCSYEFILGNHV